MSRIPCLAGLTGYPPLNEVSMRFSSTVLCFIWAAPFALCACGEQKLDAVTTSQRRLELVAESPVDPDGAFGACEVVETGGYFPFECSVSEARCSGWGGMGECSAGRCDGGGYFTLCEHECQADADCPRPETGTARPVCAASTFCQLPCDDSTRCPDGYSCELTPSFAQPEFLPRSCVQKFELVSFTQPASEDTASTPE